MAVYRVTLKDGREVEVTADSPEKADLAAGEFMRANPAKAAPKASAPAPGRVPQTNRVPVVSDALDTMGGAFGKLAEGVKADYAESTRRLRAPLPSPMQVLRDFPGDVARSGRLVGDVAGAALSPLTGLVEGALIQPGAKALDALPFKAYAIPQLGDKGPPRVLGPDERHAANADMLRMGMMAARPLPGRVAPIPPPEALPRGLAVGGLPRATAAYPLTPRPSAMPVAARAPSQAAAYVDRVVKASGVAPESLAATSSPQRPITAAEALGRSGQSAVGALARRPGQTGDALSALVGERQMTRPDRMQADFADAAGVIPEAAAADLEALVQAGRQRAAPLYEQAYSAGPVSTPKLSGLLQRPSMKAAMGRAYKLAAEEGESPEGLGLVDVEIPGAWDSIAAPEVASTGKAVRGPAKPPSRGDSLLRYIGKKGGISDAADEITAMDGHLWHKGRAYQRPLAGNGSTLDDMALRAWEDGYFPEFQTRPSERDLLDAMQGELSGRPRYARAPDAGAQGRYDAREAADELAYRGGDPADLPSPEQYQGRAAPQYEPANEFQPTARTWDYVKRGLDDELNARRDPVTGKLPRDQHTRALVATVRELRQELTRANPAYGEALAASGDYLSAEQAFKDGGRFVFDGRMTERQLTQHLDSLSEAERTAFKGGIANRIFDLAQNGKLDPKTLRAPRIQTKLRLSLGKDEADALISAAGDEGAMMAFERRYGPAGNSITAEMSDAMGLQDAQGPLGQMAGDFLGNLHRGPVAGATAALGGQARNLLAGVRTPGLSVEARDLAGQMLLSEPGQLSRMLQERGINPGVRLPPARGLFGRRPLGAIPLPPQMVVPAPERRK